MAASGRATRGVQGREPVGRTILYVRVKALLGKHTVERKELSPSLASKGVFHRDHGLGRRFHIGSKSVGSPARRKHERREAFCAPKGFGTSWGSTSLVKSFSAARMT